MRKVFVLEGDVTEAQKEAVAALFPDIEFVLAKDAGKQGGDEADEQPAPEYHPLQIVFDQCVEQAASGKGEQRHGHGVDFMDQPWKKLTDAFGVGGPLFQAAKKTRESLQWIDTEEHFRFKTELLGAINYLAMAVLAYEEAVGTAECAGCAECSCACEHTGECASNRAEQPAATDEQPASQPTLTPLKFSPSDGSRFLFTLQSADEFRAMNGPVAWLYNPWTGEQRDARDIGTDTFGHLITPQ